MVWGENPDPREDPESRSPINSTLSSIGPQIRGSTFCILRGSGKVFTQDNTRRPTIGGETRKMPGGETLQGLGFRVFGYSKAHGYLKGQGT